jgi:hypothetical protein
VARTEELLSGLDRLPDGRAAALATETVEALVGLYGEALARITDRLTGAALAGLADDDLVGHLLLAHGLHPDPPEVRARRALRDLRADGTVSAADVLDLTPTTARLRVRPAAPATGCGCGTGGGTGTGTGTGDAVPDPERAVRDALAARAPEIEHVEIEVEAAPETPAPAPAARPAALIPVDALFTRPPARPDATAAGPRAGITAPAAPAGGGR